MVKLKLSRRPLWTRRDAGHLLAAGALWIGTVVRPAAAVDAVDPEGIAILGNKAGSLKLLEFFDYNCGPCRHVFPDMLDLLAAEPRLKIVLLDFPILSSASRDVARVAIAVRLQDPDGAKFPAFHRKLMSHAGPNDGERAIEAAQSAGFDMERLAHDMASPTVDKVLQETFKFADRAGVNATPSFMMDGRIFVGEDGFQALRYKLEDARK